MQSSGLLSFFELGVKQYERILDGSMKARALVLQKIDARRIAVQCRVPASSSEILK